MINWNWEIETEIEFEMYQRSFDANVMKCRMSLNHYNGVTMSIMASKITGASTVCLSICLDGHRKNNKSCVTGFLRGNPPVTGGYPSQRSSYTEIVSIWWRHHDYSDDIQL